ncbi:hypothetical protein Tco_0994749 [Tanacetum coccineum]
MIVYNQGEQQAKTKLTRRPFAKNNRVLRSRGIACQPTSHCTRVHWTRQTIESFRWEAAKLKGMAHASMVCECFSKRCWARRKGMVFDSYSPTEENEWWRMSEAFTIQIFKPGGTDVLQRTSRNHQDKLRKAMKPLTAFKERWTVET